MPPRHELTRADILRHAMEIREDYENDGMKLTLRQMYYQFVSLGICPSGQLHYKRIGDVLTDARYAGEYPIDGLEDRGREVHHGNFTTCEDDVDDALDTASNTIRWLPDGTINIDRWYGQRNHVSVWVEKQALEGVFEPVCKELGVSWFACKGYPSVSALWSWIQSAERAHHDGTVSGCTVLYFGDHDPDGWEIPRSALRNIGKLLEVQDIALRVKFKRVALNMDQIRRYNPPSFEAKVTSARYQGYIDEHQTDEAWELDALEPRVLRDLIRTEVNALFDASTHRRQMERRDALRADVRDRMMDPEWMRDVMGGM